MRPWKVNLGYSTIPTARDGKNNSKDDDMNEGQKELQTDKGTLVINKPAILNEIARLGGELIERIEVKRPGGEGIAL